MFLILKFEITKNKIFMFDMYKSACLYRIFLCIASLGMSSPLVAETFIINSRIGNDNNTGTTKEAIWKSLKNLEKNIFKPGDSILFAKRSSYTGGFVFNSSGSAEKPIVFSNYSVGADIITSTPREILSNIFVKNFRLRENSPAINAAIRTMYKKDLDGYPIPKKGLPDIGFMNFKGYLNI